MADRLQRPLRDLRISVMDRCNFRCPYCMPEDKYHPDFEFLKSSERLSFEEILRLAHIFAGLGVRKLRITGGEPLLRPNIAELVGDLSRVPGIDDIALTTNGILLAQHAAALKAAGLSRVTVSLDSLDDAVFLQMSGGRGSKAQVLEGIHEAITAGLTPIKVNAVVKRGVNEHTVVDLVEHFRGTGVIVRFIEYMDVGTINHWQASDTVPSRELLAMLAARWPLTAVRAELPRRGRRAVPLRRRRRRGGLHLVRVRALLRLLHPGPALVRRPALHLPVRVPRHGPQGPAAGRPRRRPAARADHRRVDPPGGPLQRAAGAEARQREGGDVLHRRVGAPVGAPSGATAPVSRLKALLHNSA